MLNEEKETNLLVYISNHREFSSGIVLLIDLLDFGYGPVKCNTNVLPLCFYMLVTAIRVLPFAEFHVLEVRPSVTPGTVSRNRGLSMSTVYLF